MPQFDTSFYLAQIIWMFGSFAFLYVMMAFLICPMIEDVFNERKNKIQQDLDMAERLKKHAEVLHQRYQAFYLSAEKEKSQYVQDAYAQIQKKASQTEKKNDAQLRQKVRQAEKKIDNVKQKIQHDSEMLSNQLAESFVKRLMVEGDDV